MRNKRIRALSRRIARQLETKGVGTHHCEKGISTLVMPWGIHGMTQVIEREIIRWLPRIQGEKRP
jgi:hypothetical protein